MKNLNVKHPIHNLIISMTSVLVISFLTTPSIAEENVTRASHSASQQQQLEQSLNQQSNNNEQDEVVEFSQAQLEQILAPIALYPDSLLSHILIASTYPIEVIDAERWLEKNHELVKDNNNKALMDAAEDQDWDASVKALLPFENIIKKLSNDLHWMTNLGDAFLQDQAKVLASVQSLRQQADTAGNLDKMDNVNVVRESKTIIIQAAEPEVIYVPYYDTRVVYGDWRWSHYPPIYWHYPRHYVRHRGPYYWHNPVHLSVGLFFGGVHWHNRHVVVHHHKSRYYKRHSHQRVTRNYQSKKWQHKPRHRKGVAYRNSRIQKKYRRHTPSVDHYKNTRAKHVSLARKTKHHDTHINSRHSDSKRQYAKVHKAKSSQHRVKKSYNEKRKVKQTNVKEYRGKAQHIKAYKQKSVPTTQKRVKTVNVKSNASNTAHVKRTNYKNKPKNSTAKNHKKRANSQKRHHRQAKHSRQAKHRSQRRQQN